MKMENKQLILDLLHDNRVSFAKIHSLQEYKKTKISDLLVIINSVSKSVDCETTYNKLCDIMFKKLFDIVRIQFNINVELDHIRDRLNEIGKMKNGANKEAN